MTHFPLTTVGIFARSLGILIGVTIMLSLFEEMFFAKAVGVFFLAVLFNLFAIQQIATNTRTVTIQWILSLAFSGLGLLLPALIYLIKGLIFPVRNFTPPPADDQTTSS